MSMKLMFILLPLIYLSGNAYLYWKMLQAVSGVPLWVKVCISIIFWVAAFSMFVSIGLKDAGVPQVVLKILFHVGSVWMAFLLYSVLLLILTDFVRILVPAIGPGLKYVLPVVVILLVYGYVSYRNPVINNVDIVLDKEFDGEVTAVAISDIHLGHGTGPKALKRYVDMINAQNPDAIIYSISTEFTTLKGIFVSEGTDLVGLSSFFHNENLFAMFILYAIFGCFILNFYHTRPHNYILIAGLFFYMTLTTCAATFFVGLCAVIIYIIFDLIRNFKKHWVLTLISAGISTAIIVGAIIFFSTAYSNEISWVKNLFTYIQKEIFSKDFNTFTGRTRIWKDVFDNLINTNLVNLLIGRGYGTSSMFLKGLGLMHSSGSFDRAIISAHNGLINILLNSGLIGLGLYAILILLVAFTCIYLLFKKKVNLSITFGLIICGVLAHSLLESVAFYSTSMVNMLVTIMFTCPLFNCARGVFKPKLVNQVKNGDYAYSKMQYRKLRRFISVVIISLIIPCVTLLTSLMTYQHKEMLNTVLTILVVLAISLIFVPQLITMFYKDSSRKRFIFRTIFLTWHIMWL